MQEHARQAVENNRQALQAARERGDERAVCTAAAQLGYQLYQRRSFAQGTPLLEEAVEIARRLGDTHLVLSCLEVQVRAYQEAGRLPDAYQAAQAIEQIADDKQDMGMKFDAVASQGQILLDSGEPMIAFDRLRQARQIAEAAGDQRRLMQVLGALGNFSIAVTALDKAAEYFDDAALLAQAEGDAQAALGFLGNKAIVLNWQGRHTEAVKLFLELLPAQQNVRAQIQMLLYLAKSYQGLGQEVEFVQTAARGLDLARADDPLAAVAFLEMLVPVAYQQQNIEEAHTLTQEAVELARKAKDRSKELEFRISLAESYLVTGQTSLALEAYRKAKDLAGKIERLNDEAYLTGRIGLALAEMGSPDEALAYHQQALELAQARGLADLAGEQLSMLAMAYRDLGQMGEARTACQQAVTVYAQAGLKDLEGNARELMKELHGE